MSFKSILVPHDGSPEAAKALGCGAWLAQRLDAVLHVLTPATLEIPAQLRARMVLERTAEHPGSAVPKAIAAHAVDLVVMTARGESASVERERRLGHAAEDIIARSAVPLLLLPLHYREALPWTSMLVAASGEAAADQALQAALELAGALQLELSVAYCESSRTKAQALGAYADAAHHEYAQRLEEMVRRTAAQHTEQERRCIGSVLLCRGDPADELLAQIAQRGSSVVALGWHGALGAGRAPVLKRLLDQAECPLLVVRQEDRPTARLMIGEDL